MKKVLSILVLAMVLVLMLTGCASFDRYEKNLGKYYTVYHYEDADEIEDLADSFYVDADEYDISAVMEVEDDYYGYYAYIIECGSHIKANRLARELEDVAEMMGEYYDVDVVSDVDGKYVLVGNKEVVEDALKK